MIKISVIIPVFNAEKFLAKSLASVCNQSLREIEIICINDCSTDDSWLLLQQYAKNDWRIKLIDLPKNKGAAAARNIGIENANGQYLGFVDADDFIDENFYEKLYERAIASSADAVKGNIKIYCPKTNSSSFESWIDINNLVKQHPANFYFSFTTAIFKTSFIKENSVKFLEGLIHFEDPYFTIKAALFYQKLEVVDEVFYYYVNNPISASRNFSASHSEALVEGAAKVMDLLDENCADKTHYMIVFNFLLNQILATCNRIGVNDEVNIKAVPGLFILFNRCRYKEECVTNHFLQKKKSQKEEVIKQLRSKVKNDLNNA